MQFSTISFLISIVSSSGERNMQLLVFSNNDIHSPYMQPSLLRRFPVVFLVKMSVNKKLSMLGELGGIQCNSSILFVRLARFQVNGNSRKTQIKISSLFVVNVTLFVLNNWYTYYTHIATQPHRIIIGYKKWKGMRTPHRYKNIRNNI